MKTMKKGIILGILALTAGIACAMEERENSQPKEQPKVLILPNTYKGQPITPKTLPGMLSEMPKEIKEAIDKYEAEKPGRLQWYATVDLLQGFDYFRTERARKAVIFGQDNISNAKHNYVFKTGPAIIKISGENNRFSGMLTTKRFNTRDSGVVKGDFNFPFLTDPKRETDKLNGIQYHDRIFEMLMVALSDEYSIDTYQTASRAAAALLVNQLNLPDVKAPNTYLMMFDQDKGIVDNNCIVVQEAIEGATPLDQLSKEEIEQINPQTFAHYMRAIVGAGLFQPRVLVKNGEFWLVDLEQQNICNANLFKHKQSENELYKDNHTNEYVNAVGSALRELVNSKAMQVPTIKKALWDEFNTNHNIQVVRGAFWDVEAKLKQ